MTDEWKDRGASKETDFAILTNEITKATFGKTVQEYKKFKGVPKKNQNLRDHMTDWELILTMVGEKATMDITVARDAHGMDECAETAREGGTIASNTKKGNRGKNRQADRFFRQLSSYNKEEGLEVRFSSFLTPGGVLKLFKVPSLSLSLEI